MHARPDSGLVAPRPRALIVDHDAASVAALISALAALDTPCDHAPTGRAAVRRLRAGDYTIALVARRLADMDAASLLAWMREHLAPRPHVVVLTAPRLYPPLPAAGAATWETTGDARLEKPISLARLTPAVSPALHARLHADARLLAAS